MLRCCIVFVLCLAPLVAQPHGGVVEEEDLCVIKVNYLRGHFKIYQPLTSGHREYCEDLPDATESVFVMEYLHDGLANAAVDFRIIRDVTGKGRFARWDDVQAIDNLDAATVFYRPPAVDPDVLTVIHEFEEEGDFIGIVTANVDGDLLINTAEVDYGSGVVTDTADVELVEPTLVIDKVAAPTNANVGDTVTFTLQVSNAGPDDATVQVMNLLPDGYTYVSDTGGGDYDSVTGAWMPGTVASGMSAKSSRINNWSITIPRSWTISRSGTCCERIPATERA